MSASFNGHKFAGPSSNIGKNMKTIYVMKKK